MNVFALDLLNTLSSKKGWYKVYLSVDHLPQNKRSWNMGRIRSKNTKPEIAFRKLIYRAGFRYKLYVKELPGKPDLVLNKYRTVVFVHGCFWHRHNCKRGNRPKSNNEYWNVKLDNNVRRDRKYIWQLENNGWRVFIAWECELKELKKVFEKFKTFINTAEDLE